MEIKIVAEASKKKDRVLNNWGLSFLIGKDILFDTFSNEKILKNNFRELQINPKQIKFVVVSHDHWDHTGGLWWLLEQNQNLQVFITKGFSSVIKEKFKKYENKIIVVSGLTEIKKDIFIIGPLKGKYNNTTIYEQALFIKKEFNGQVKNIIITGCSHPGIINILDFVKKYSADQFYLVLGGMHLLNKSGDELEAIIFQLKNNYYIEKIAPCHCTGEKAVKIIKKEFKSNYIEIFSKKILKFI